MIYTHLRKHLQFKSNKMNNKNPIQINQNNSHASGLKQQFHNLIIMLFSLTTSKIPLHFPDSLTSSIPWLSLTHPKFQGQWEPSVKVSWHQLVQSMADTVSALAGHISVPAGFPFFC